MKYHLIILISLIVCGVPCLVAMDGAPEPGPTPTAAARACIAELQKLYQKAAGSSSFCRASLDYQYEKYRRRFETMQCDADNNNTIFNDMTGKIAAINAMSDYTIMMKTHPKSMIAMVSLLVGAAVPIAVYCGHQALEQFKKKEKGSPEDSVEQLESDAVVTHGEIHVKG